MWGGPCGSVIYVNKHVEATDPGRKPRLVIGHDTRHFSRDFAEFCAKIGTDLGVTFYLFDSPRATPEISFATRNSMRFRRGADRQPQPLP